MVKNAKDYLDMVLAAHVAVSCDAGDETHVALRDIEAYLNDHGITFTLTKQDPKDKDKKVQVEMTERAKKVMVGAAKKRLVKVLEERGMTTDAAEKQVKVLSLKRIKDPASMSNKTEDFDFDAYLKDLKKLAKGK